MSKWTRKGVWWIESQTGARVSKAIVQGQPVYTAWVPCESENPYAKVGYRAVLYSGDPEAAKAAAETG